MEQFGIRINEARFFMPPYEWYNREVSDWTKELGLELINFTPAIGTNADYTVPDMNNYRSSNEIVENLKRFEKNNGLNGAILLIHPGTEPERTDKFYYKLDELIEYLSDKGYQFRSVKTLL